MSNFETWWEREGQEFLYALNTTTDDDIKLVAEIAWKNGAYCAEQAEQEPVAWVDLEQWQSGEYDCFTSEKVADYMTPLYAAPVRTKDLTNSEKLYILGSHIDPITKDVMGLSLIDAAIAADREKNK